MLESKPIGRGPAHESAVLARTLQVYGKIARRPCKIGLQCRRVISRTEVTPNHHPSESNGCHDSLQRGPIEEQCAFARAYPYCGLTLIWNGMLTSRTGWSIPPGCEGASRPSVSK